VKHITVHLRGGTTCGFDVDDQAEVDGLVATARAAWNGAGGVLTVAGTPEFHINLAAADVFSIVDATGRGEQEIVARPGPRWPPDSENVAPGNGGA
jgi:hypothetical protein